jgi:hypothetical protein
MRPAKDRKPKFIKPKNTFKEKVGSGGLAPELVDKGQKLIEKNDNFEPHAKVYLERIASTLSLHEHHNLIGSEARILLINPVMQIKGNAGMFQYHLMSEISDILLSFLENIDSLNQDSLAVVKAHHAALQAILSAGLKGSGGAEGRALAAELEKATTRYYDKYRIEPK